MPYVVRTTEDRELRCPLTDDEVQQRAERVAELLEQADDVAAESAAARARFKSRSEEIARERRKVLDEYRTRSTLRVVPCELQVDLEAKRAQWVRTDSGEVILERGLRDEERQAHLFEPQGEAGEPEGGELEDEDPAPPRRGRRKAETAGAAAQ